MTAMLLPFGDPAQPFSGEHLRGLFMHTPWPVGIYRGPTHILELLNPEFLRVTAPKRGNPIGRPYAEIFPELAAQGVVQLLDRVYCTGEVVSGQAMHAVVELGDGRTRDGYWDYVLQPWRDGKGVVMGIIAASIEVTDQVNARLSAEAQSRRMQLLAEAGAVLSSSLDYRATLDRVAALPVPALADWCFVDLVDDDGWLDRVAVAHADPSRHAVAASLRRRLAPRLDVAHGISRAIARAEPQLANDVGEALLHEVARDQQHLETLRQLEMKSFVTAPMSIGGRAIGALTLTSRSRRYEPADLDFVVELARRAALAIDNARLYASQKAALAQLSSLQQVTSELSRARTAEEVAAATVRLGAAAVSASASAVWLLERDGALRLVGSIGVPASFMADWSWLAPDRRELPAFVVLDSGEPLWVETTTEYASSAPSLLRQAIAAGRVNGFAALPLVDANQRIGVLSFSYPVEHRFTPAEKDVILTLGRQCAQALARARLFEGEAAARRQAEAAREQAQLASNSKDEFLAMLGHELRNPLSPIVTALHLMKLRGEKSTREREIIERQVRHLTRLVDDLLDVSRVARGKIELKRVQADFGEIVAKAVEMASPLYEQKRHRLEIDVEAGLHVEADETRLAQVIANLLTNAAKFSDDGGRVEVQARRDGGEIVLAVKDGGIGIDGELLPRIFDLFVQGKRGADRSQSGLGLGLTLVRSLVELHGGSVSAHSDGAGTGSRFVVRLPALPAVTLAPGHAAAPSAAASAAGAARRILVVDDNVDAAALLAELLRQAGHTVAVAHDAPAALAIASDVPLEIAILDIGLPVMDGYELAQRLGARATAARPYLIALTGYGQPHDRARSAEAGFDVHMVKPLDPERLLSAVARVPRPPRP